MSRVLPLCQFPQLSNLFVAAHQLFRQLLRIVLNRAQGGRNYQGRGQERILKLLNIDERSSRKNIN